MKSCTKIERSLKIIFPVAALFVFIATLLGIFNTIPFFSSVLGAYGICTIIVSFKRILKNRSAKLNAHLRQGGKQMYERRAEIHRHIAILDKLYDELPNEAIFYMKFPPRLDAIGLNKLASAMASYAHIPCTTFIVDSAFASENNEAEISWPTSGFGVAYISVKKELLEHVGVCIKVLAHEIAHEYLRLHSISYKDVELNERMTDVTSVYLGFGYYIINEPSYTTFKEDAVTRKIHRIEVTPGYLTKDEFQYVHSLINEVRGEKWRQSIPLYGELDELPSYEVLASSKIARNKTEKLVREISLCMNIEDLHLANIENLISVNKELLYSLNDKVISIRNKQRLNRESLQKIKKELAQVGERTTRILRLPWQRELMLIRSNINSRRSELCCLEKECSRGLKNGEIKLFWQKIDNIVCMCPMCMGKLRLPTRHGEVEVKCNKCGCVFRYLTDAPKIGLGLGIEMIKRRLKRK